MVYDLLEIPMISLHDDSIPSTALGFAQISDNIWVDHSIGIILFVEILQVFMFSLSNVRGKRTKFVSRRFHKLRNVLSDCFVLPEIIE